MLVLSRKPQERIQIGDNVVITILQVKGRAVRIGIEAPRDVRVLRSELADQAPAADQTMHSSGSESISGEPTSAVRANEKRPLRPTIGHNRLRRWPMNSVDMMRRHG